MRLGFRRDPAAAWIDDYVAAWNAHDPVAVTDFMTNNVVYIDFGLGEEYRGIAAVRDFVEGMAPGVICLHLERFMKLVAERNNQTIVGGHSRTTELCDNRKS